MRGGTSLRLNLPISELASMLDEGSTLFASDAYKKDWPDIDNINPVKDDLLIGKLEQTLDEDFANGKQRPPSRSHLRRGKTENYTRRFLSLSCASPHPPLPALTFCLTVGWVTLRRNSSNPPSRRQNRRLSISSTRTVTTSKRAAFSNASVTRCQWAAPYLFWRGNLVRGR